MSSLPNVVPACPRCLSPAVKHDGRRSPGHRRLRWGSCRRPFTERTGTPFAGYRWPRAVLVRAVRWYGRFRLSIADIRDLLAERGMDVSARTISAWVHPFGPLLAAVARRHAGPVGRCWSVDEIYVRAGSRWMYLDCAVTEHGQVVDMLLCEQRDLGSARAFFAQAIARRGVRPTVVITDKPPACRRATRCDARRARHVWTGWHRARDETTNPIERAHLSFKDWLRPMRSPPSVRTGQRVLGTVQALQPLRRSVHHSGSVTPASAHAQAGAVAARVDQCAAALRPSAM